MNEDVENVITPLPLSYTGRTPRRHRRYQGGEGSEERSLHSQIAKRRACEGVHRGEAASDHARSQSRGPIRSSSSPPGSPEIGANSAGPHHAVPEEAHPEDLRGGASPPAKSPIAEAPVRVEREGHPLQPRQELPRAVGLTTLPHT